MRIIKRNGKEVIFEKAKIINAISKANAEIHSDNLKLTDDEISAIADAITKHCESMSRAMDVEEIQDLVENKLMETGKHEVARKYITYRYEHSMKRQANTTDGQILSLIECENEEVKQENSNKNPTVVSVQRDYMAGEVSKDITRRFLLPKDVIDAHDAGIIHFHDMDYFAQHTNNCFHSKTKFVTSEGVLQFGQCIDGQIVEVIDKNGKWRKATVRKYNSQKMQKVILQSCRSITEIKCTYDHRWILKDGSITTNLKVGDRLTLLNEVQNDFELDEKAFCIGFVLGDGSEFKYNYENSCSEGVRVRLCGDKIKHLDMFLRNGFRKSNQNLNDNDVIVHKTGHAYKKDFLKAKAWKFLNKNSAISLFNGYYAADGHKHCNGIATANPLLAEMIRDISAIAGYYIASETYEVRNTPYKENAELYTFKFRKYQKHNNNWIVKAIIRDDTKKYDAWCVEEPVTKTFTLDSGIVTGNCDLVNLDDMLQNGTVISETLIEKPHSFATACNIATQIIAQVASSQYGGQSITLSHLAPFVDISRKKHRQDVREELESAGLPATDEQINKIAELRTRDEIKRGIQTIQYQVITLMTTNGQAPFITVFMYLNEVPEGQLRDDLAIMIEETLRQRTKGVKNEKGVWIAPAFPKLIYVLQEDNVTKDSKYFYLTELAAKCTAKRLVPDYISEKIMLENKGDVFPPMGCRSFVVYDGGLPNIAKAKNYKPNEHKYYGHFNQGVVTINLPDVALSSHKDTGKFWQILDERLELCHKALRCRHERLLGTPSDVAPILWQNGALARLEKGEVIDPLLFGSYSTISLGYAGIYEMTKYMTGESHTSDKGREFAISVMQKLNDKVDQWKAAENIGYGIYSTPLESTVYKFAKSLRNRFGIIEGITDRNYITNSYHVHVTENIDAFSKLSFEAPFQKLALSGCISYVEVPNMKNNIEAIISLLQHIYNTTMYAELNTKSDYCQCCGFDGEIQIVDDNEKLVWECPNCGNRDQNKLNVARRTCGRQN